MKILTALLVALLTGCANAPPMPPADDLFHDAAFQPPKAHIDPAAPLALSPAMRDYLATTFQNRSHAGNRRDHLVEALYRGGLRLEYDAAVTRTAAEAFDARAGNCLALVLMTSAFAQQLGLSVHYQSVLGEQAWDRADDLYIAIGHVNLRIDDTQGPIGLTASTASSVVIDFLPPRDAQRLVTEPIAEKRVIGMFLNNRAVEALTQGQENDAYWWAREALRQDPGLLSAYVTLGVIYRRQHHPDWSEAALERVSDRSPDDLYAMSNRILALRDLGREAEATALSGRLARLDPAPPFLFFRQGMAALHAGRPELARRFFAQEVDRAPYHAEFEYWLAVSYIELNDPAHASQHLQLAVEASTTRKDHDLYAAKLERLKTLRGQ